MTTYKDFFLPCPDCGYEFAIMAQDQRYMRPIWHEGEEGVCEHCGAYLQIALEEDERGLRAYVDVLIPAVKAEDDNDE